MRSKQTDMTDTADSATKVDAETSNGICRSVRAADAAAGFVVGEQGAELFAPAPQDDQPFPLSLTEREESRRRCREADIRMRCLELAIRHSSHHGDMGTVVATARKMEAFVLGAETTSQVPCSV